jgi:hypothetical protein
MKHKNLSVYFEQVFLPPEQFLVMNSTDLFTMSKKRPVDELFGIISKNDKYNLDYEDEVNQFIDDHGIKET